MRACSGVWVAHGSGDADRERVDPNDHVRVPPGEESYDIRRVWLSEEEEKGYYYGYSNEGLWPLCHVAHTRPAFRAEDWRQYHGVNRKFADVVCGEVDSKDPIILVQDYHFALAPAMIRQRLAAASRAILARLAQERTLCAFDFDGTLSPIVEHPDQAECAIRLGFCSAAWRRCIRASLPRDAPVRTFSADWAA
jgi:hypothetical protein